MMWKTTNSARSSWLSPKIPDEHVSSTEARRRPGSLLLLLQLAPFSSSPFAEWGGEGEVGRGLLNDVKVGVGG